jgi:hypothetical protein
MSPATNPAAPHHQPAFFTAPGETDILFNVMAIFLVVTVLMVAVFYFKLHSLPEKIAHKGQKVQFEIVAVLGLISLFTHNHIFWIAGLLLAFIPMPDFSTPLNGMADSLAKMAGWRTGATLPPLSAERVLPEQVNAAVPKQVAAESGSSAIASSSAHFGNGTHTPSKKKA